jgi:hypothetical protein
MFGPTVSSQTAVHNWRGSHLAATGALSLPGIHSASQEHASVLGGRWVDGSSYSVGEHTLMKFFSPFSCLDVVQIYVRVYIVTLKGNGFSGFCDI